MAGPPEALDALALLQEDLKDDDYEQAIAAINRLGTVAQALGPERVRKELLPFLMGFSDTDNDEAQTAVGAQLGDFLPWIGGPDHVTLCLPLLEKLAGEEEVVVREAAVGSIGKLTKGITPDMVIKDIIPLINRLAQGAWFTTRVSACGIVPTAYNQLTDAQEPQREDLRKTFAALASDETPMVRRGVYVRLGEYAQAVKPHFKSDILPIMKALTRDPTDTMRLLIVDVIIKLKVVLSEAEFEGTILPLLEVLEDDTSWRVRQSLVNALSKICKGTSPASSLKSIIPLYVKLLADKESEVRQSASKVLADVGAEVKGSDTLLVDLLETLATDTVVNVRLNLAKTIVPYCQHCNKELVAKTVLPVIRTLAKDESYEVRSQILGDIDLLSDYVNPTAFLGLFPVLLELSKDPKWRVRAAVIRKCSALAKLLGPKKFEKQLQPMIITALSDHVFAIREEACEQVGKIVQEFGGKWAQEKFFPAAIGIYDKNTNYLYRMTCLLFILKSADHCSPEVCEKALLPVILPAGSDDVANVRIQFSKTLIALIPKLDGGLVSSKLTPLLQKLSKDPDDDVNYFARLCLDTHSLPLV
eukprot:gb/GEZN01002890.1/.p1 GENE.gb/GEZN01002890.1/~~gb/GEZN01002890.1/.p1  ORF type:complete len:587 (+),score=85.51 gb/GEZN01002890.1/:72-1832(+)